MVSLLKKNLNKELMFGGGGGGVGSMHLEREFLHGHAEWVKTRDLTLGNFDSHLRIKVTAL